jgi:hypothetical protein
MMNTNNASPMVLAINVRKSSDVEYLAEWSANGVGARGFRSHVPLDAIRKVLDSIWDEGTRRRGRGRPSVHSKRMRSLVWCRSIQVVIQVDPAATAGQKASAA